MDNTAHGFDTHHVLHELKHLLPAQSPIKDFIHHNSLHAYQHLPFYEAIFKASEIFGYQVTLQLNDFRRLYNIGRIKEEVLDRIITDSKGAANLSEWKSKLLSQNYNCNRDPRIGKLRSLWQKQYGIDLNNLVLPKFFRIISSYLDQGVSLWHFPNTDLGFLDAIRLLESNSFSSFFGSLRAKQLLRKKDISIKYLLDILVNDERFYEQYLFDQQFAHHGWSGMVAAIEAQPETLLYSKKINLEEFIIFELLLELDALQVALGSKWHPLGDAINFKPVNLFEEVASTELQEVLKVWQDAFEWSYYDQVLAGIFHAKANPKAEKNIPSMQAVFCIDERECSLRRHIEYVDPKMETLGSPGFFGVEFYFEAEHSKFYEKLCPAPVTPKYLIKEKEVKTGKKHDLLYNKKTHHFFEGFMFSLGLGIWAAIKMFLNLFNPKMSPAISNAFSHMDMESVLEIENTDANRKENNLQVGFTVQEMAVRVEGLLRGIGLINNFASIVYIISHGSSSANNPHHGAHDCGACSGRPGAVNARVFCFMANHPQVRAILAANGLHIPETTQFVAAMHDTASDLIGYYDEKVLTGNNINKHKHNKELFEKALDLNAKERSRRFASINTKAPIQKVRESIEKRSVSFFEPRPELGHGTNALCFVGNRALTRGLFLDRRAFLNSYDYRTDLDGKLLLGVMRPLPPVCGGINLEYYFSRVDNYKIGAGTKLPHNVMGLIGVANSSDGDLRPGLPLQMIEVHDPVRLMIIVEHYPEVILKTIQQEKTLYEWFKNEWVHLTSIHPDTGEFYYFKNEVFTKYETLANHIPGMEDIHELIENAKEMETNYITHATQENLPVYLIK